MIDRRSLIVGLTCCSYGSPAVSSAPFLIAVLEGTSEEVAQSYLDPFEAALRERGHHVGRSITFVRKFANGDAGRYPELAAQLVGLNPAVIVTGSTTATLACQKLTTRVAIVSSNLTDPVGTGLISSLARPGGNITGVTVSFESLPSKLLHMLVEVLPTVKRVGVLSNSTERAGTRQRDEAQRAAQQLGMTIIGVEVRSSADFDGAFREFAGSGVSAVYAQSSLLLRTQRHRFAEAAINYGIPIFCNAREIVEAGGLMSYGADLRENYRRAGYFVDRILAGASPATLPTENPTRFSCSVNMRTARTLAVTLPPALLALADEVFD
jgi:putative ABC transport system substrate-binding protein